MAINRTFSGAVFPPNASVTMTSGTVMWKPMFGPEWVRHYVDADPSDAVRMEDLRFALAMLRALTDVRIISGVRMAHWDVFWIDARIPSDER